MDELAIIRERVRGIEVRVEDLEKWQARQNGSIQRVEDDVKEIRKTLLSMTYGIVVSAIGAIGSLVVLLINYLMGRIGG